MAMNKKEQAEFANMQKKLAVASAFMRTPAVKKDVPVPDVKYSNGYDFNLYYQAVCEYWSGPCTHYSEDPTNKKGHVSGSQNGISLYSTRLLALKALRHAVENKAAEDLAKIDMQIAEEDWS